MKNFNTKTSENNKRKYFNNYKKSIQKNGDKRKKINKIYIMISTL